MASRTITGSEKGIQLKIGRIVWPSFDDCKGRNYSKGNKLFLKVSDLAEAMTASKKGKGQRKKTQAPAGLFTADLSALTRRTPSEAMPLHKKDARFADCRADTKWAKGSQAMWPIKSDLNFK